VAGLVRVVGERGSLARPARMDRGRRRYELNVLPGHTTYVVAPEVVVANNCGPADWVMAVSLTWVVLFAMRWAAWARLTDLEMSVAATMGRMLQASTMHADFVHLRTVVLLSFLRDQHRTMPARRRA
jgi:hypothetical protein